MIIKKERINELSKRVYVLNKEKGWHERELADDAYLMLIASEISEAVEADRKGMKANLDSFLSVLKGRASDKIYRALFEAEIKDTIQDELADTIIRCCDYLGSHGLKFDLGGGLTYHTPFIDTFAEKAWQWVMILADTGRKVEDRICDLVFDVLDYCDMRCFDIEKHIEAKLRYNKTRPYKHGKAY